LVRHEVRRASDCREIEPAEYARQAEPTVHTNYREMSNGAHSVFAGITESTSKEDARLAARAGAIMPRGIY